MQVVFVTGGSGFIGHNLVRQLTARGCQVRCLVRPTSSTRRLRRLGAELHVGDLTDKRVLQQCAAGVDAVFHLAGATRAVHADQFVHTNARGTWNVAEACGLQDQPPTLVVASSLAAAGPVRRGRVRNAADAPAPVSHYGRSKRAGELAAEVWADRVPTTIVRPGIVFGPWNRDLLPVFRSIRDYGVHFIPTFTPPPLSIIHVDDLVDLLIGAAERGRRIPTPAPADEDRRGIGYYFACANEYPSYTELGRMVARSVGRRHVFLYHMVEPLPWIFSGISEIAARLRRRPLPLSVDKMREATAESWASSPEASHADLGFAPQRTLQAWLNETSDWYCTRHWM